MKKQVQISLIALIASLVWSAHAFAAVAVSNQLPIARSGGSNIPTPPTTKAGANLVSAIANPDVCVMPKLSATRHIFYVDPLHGHIANNGSQASPWDTLANVVAKNLIASSKYPNAPIKSGDLIYLMSGPHGAVNLLNMKNTDFLSIEAAPGQTPLLTSLNIEGVQKLIVKGLKIQSLASGYSGLIHISSASLGPSENVIIENNSLSSQDNVDSWSQADWLAKGRWLGIATDGRGGTNCLTITNNHISNVRFGVSLTAENTLYSYNTIDNFGDDGVDYAASNLVISHNTVTNNHVLGDGNHNDGMQGQDASTTLESNDVIDSNVVINQTNPNLAFPGGLQGIDAFDGNYANLTVTNNTVISNAYHGIAFASVQGGLIAHNTVLTAWNPKNPLNAHFPGLWITVGSTTHEGSPSHNLTVRDNICSTLSMPANVEGLVVTHNISNTQIAIPVSGKEEYYHGKNGVYGNDNTLLMTMLSAFTAFDDVHMIYDLQQVKNSPLAGYGSNNTVIVNYK